MRSWRSLPWLWLLGALLGCTAQPSVPGQRAASSEAWRKTPPASAQPKRVSFPVPERSKLPNGLTLLVQPSPGGLISINVVSKQSSAELDYPRAGLAALTTRLMTEAAQGLSPTELSEQVEDLGSSLQQRASRDSLRISMTLLKQDAARGMELLARVVRTPAFSPEDLARVKQQWLTDLAAERQEPERLAVLAGLRALLGPTRGAPVSGTETSVQALTNPQLVSFHAQAFRPSRCALVVTGDTSLDQVMPLAQQHFGDWQDPSPALEPGSAPQAAAAPVPEPKQPTPRVYLVNVQAAAQTAVFVAQRFPKRLAEGHEARELLSSVLGGLFTSRLNQNLREREALTYGVGGRAIATRHWGALVIMTSVNAGAAGRALREIYKELGAITKTRPVEQAELDRAQADALGQLAGAKGSVASLAGSLEEVFAQGLAEDALARRPAQLRAVTLQALQREATRLTPEGLVVVLVGEAKALKAELAPLGLHAELAPSWLLE